MVSMTTSTAGPDCSVVVVGGIGVGNGTINDTYTS